MKQAFGIELALACLLAATPWLGAQAAGGGNSSSSGQDNSGSRQSQPAANSDGSAPAQQPSRVKTQTNANPFPEDTSSVPVIPTEKTPDLPPDVETSRQRISMPEEDADPVRSPEDAAAAAGLGEKDSSSSLAGMGNLLPSPDDETQPGKRTKNGREAEPEHHETAAEDENVGNYYLDNKDWKAALSRFESAMVLDPDNPDVYWGLAECQRHLGNFAEARANYLKVTEYDPGSHHAKEARKALEDPEIANAKPVAPAPAPSH